MAQSTAAERDKLAALSEIQKDIADMRERAARAHGDAEAFVRQLREQGKDFTRDPDLVSRIEAMYSKAEALGERAETMRLQASGLLGELGAAIANGAGPFLAPHEPIAPHFKSDGWSHDIGPGRVRFGALIAGLAGGPRVIEQLDAVERQALQAMQTPTGPSGGYLLPGSVVGPFIDSVRPLVRVIEAGARTLPMDAQTVSLPGWSTPLTATWRAEGTNFGQSDPPLRQVNLRARSVGTYVTLTRELLEDAAASLGAVESIIETECARAIAQAIDLAALVGTGVDEQPLGILNTPGVVIDSTLGANGATPTDYDFLLEAAGLVAQANFVPTGVLISARTAKTLSKIKTGLAGDKTQLQIPEPLRSSMAILATNQIPNDQVKGSSGAVCSLAFTGQFDQLVIGVRNALTVVIDPYSSSKSGQVTLVMSQRADVALLNTGAFVVSDGIKP